MITKDKHTTDINITEVLLEKPIAFTLDGHFFFLYPPSLGVCLLSSELWEQLNIDKEFLLFNAQYELLRLCTEQRDTALRLVVIHTFSRRSDALREDKIQCRQDELSGIDAAGLCPLLLAILQWNNQQETLIKQTGLNRERLQLEKIKRVKKDANSITFGGRSIYGALIDDAANRYGYELGYILWGISAVNLNMMLQDRIQSVYLTEKERRKAHISTDGIYIDGSDPKNAREIQRLLRGG